MSVLQKISAAKSRRSSLQSNQSQHPEEEEVDEEESEQQLQQLLKEARQFRRQQLDGAKGRTEVWWREIFPQRSKCNQETYISWYQKIGNF